MADEFNVPNANCCLLTTAKSLADQLQDWNQLGRFHAANEELRKRAPEAGRVVFMGDSITDFWKLDESFPGKPYVNRGIGGQRLLKDGLAADGLHPNADGYKIMIPIVSAAIQQSLPGS